MVVRMAREEDAAAMARVNVDPSGVADEGWLEGSARNWARAIRETTDGTCPDNCVYVAMDETGGIVGFAIGGPPGEQAREGTGELYNLGVQASHRRRGLGRRLVQAVAAHLAQRGMPALIIGCLATNTEGRRFYEALAGRVVGERSVHEDGPEVIYGWADTRALVNAAEPGQR